MKPDPSAADPYNGEEYSSPSAFTHLACSKLCQNLVQFLIPWLAVFADTNAQNTINRTQNLPPENCQTDPPLQSRIAFSLVAEFCVFRRESLLFSPKQRKKIEINIDLLIL